MDFSEAKDIDYTLKKLNISLFLFTKNFNELIVTLKKECDDVKSTNLLTKLSKFGLLLQNKTTGIDTNSFFEESTNLTLTSEQYIDLLIGHQDLQI